MKFFDLPLDLPHAGTIALRIAQRLGQRADELGIEASRSRTLALELVELLVPYRLEGENPEAEEANEARDRAIELGRRLVDEIEAEALQEDRIGQSVRNLFETLEAGEEGAEIALRAGENPDSPMRPR